MATETERKFLVDPGLLPHLPDGEHIIQAYLNVSKQVTVRVRISARSAYITIKGPAKGISRPEFEYPVPMDDAFFMAYELSPCKPVRKIRREIIFEGKTWQLDEFEELNAGLWIAEIELLSDDEKFDLPPWTTLEVTNDPRYLNSMLSSEPYSSWKNIENGH
jgi:adenylate cyclase